jgi:hypothetical protein
MTLGIPHTLPIQPLHRGRSEVPISSSVEQFSIEEDNLGEWEVLMPVFSYVKRAQKGGLSTHELPASITNTENFGFSVKRFAITRPAVPPETIYYKQRKTWIMTKPQTHLQQQ